MAYADDVTIFCDVTSRHLNYMAPPTDLRKGSGCSFESPKIQSNVCRLVRQIDKKLIIARYFEVYVLGFRFTSTVTSSLNVTWSWTTGKFETLARDAYGRELLLKQ